MLFIIRKNISLIMLFSTLGSFPISPSTDQLLVINLSAILVGVTFNAPQKVIKWGGLIIAVATATCAAWCSH